MTLLPYEFWIGLRYVRAGRLGRRNRFISFISGLSTVGIALGVAALIVVLSVMNGFQKEVRDRMLSVLSHIEVLGASSGTGPWEPIAEQAKQFPHVIGTAPFVMSQAMLARGDTMRGTLLRGVDPAHEAKVSEVAAKQAQTFALLQPGGFGLVIGRELAYALDVRPGDSVAVIAPQGSVTPAGVLPRWRQFTVVGVFESGHYEYDSALAFMHIDDAAKLFRVDTASGVRVKLDDQQLAPEIAAQMRAKMPPTLYARDWSYENRNWFAAVQVEKRMMFIILTLIIAVAAFNLVSMLVMAVTDKQADIAILRTLGAKPLSIMKVFMVQGAIIGFIGTLAGLGLGTALAANIDSIVGFFERAFGLQVLPKGVYFIDHLPSDLRAVDVLWIGLVSLLLAFVATIYPSLKAAGVQPAQALRHEG